MQVTGNFGYFYSTEALPNLKLIIGRAFKGRPPVFTQLFNVNPSKKPFEQYAEVSGVSRFREIAQGAKIGYDQPVQGFKSTFVHKRWGLAVPTSRDMIEDDQWQLISTMHSDLAWSCRETREIDASSVINAAFTGGATVGPDGVALCSASHPLYKAGGLQSNVMGAADLDMYSLQLATTAFETQKRPSGEFIHVTPSKLVIHPSNRFIAHALTMSKDDPTTADRSVNPLNGSEDGMLTPFVYRYMTAPNQWMIMAEPASTGLVWFDRIKPETDNWVDDETQTGYIGIRYKKSHGFNNYIGVIGNSGS